MVETNILPSPTAPVFAALIIALTADSTRVSATIGQDHNLRDKIDGVFASPIDLCMTLLSSKALHIDRGHPLETEFGESVFDFFNLERFNDRFNFFHTLYLVEIGPV